MQEPQYYLSDYYYLLQVVIEELQLRLFLLSSGVIAVVIFLGVSLSAVTARVLYRRKGTCPSQEVKRVKADDGPELAFSSSQNGPSENQKEFFI